jgi:hypothetical protein
MDTNATRSFVLLRAHVVKSGQRPQRSAMP